MIQDQVRELRALLDLLHPDFSHFSGEKRLLTEKFYFNLLTESENQNLTRLLEPKAFYEGHFLDCWELMKTGWVEKTALDLGSGPGVPGILAAILADPPFPKWIVTDSERRKAEYLAHTVKDLGLGDRIVSFHGRGEAYLQENLPIQSIVSRAVGKVEKIYSWLADCSTWNNLILFKGPKWEEEWREFQRSKFRNCLKWVATHEYSVGENAAIQRKIILLQNVPRGTSPKNSKNNLNSR